MTRMRHAQAAKEGLAMMELEEHVQESQAKRFFELAYALQMAGDYEEAIALYKRSVELSPTAKGYTFLGWALSFVGQYELAIEECKRAIELDPTYGNSWNDLGAYLIELGRYDEAVPFLEEALKSRRYENFCYPYFNLHRVFLSKGMLMRAREMLQRALEANPNYQPARNAGGRQATAVRK